MKNFSKSFSVALTGRIGEGYYLNELIKTLKGLDKRSGGPLAVAYSGMTKPNGKTVKNGVFDERGVFIPTMGCFLTFGTVDYADVEWVKSKDRILGEESDKYVPVLELVTEAGSSNFPTIKARLLEYCEYVRLENERIEAEKKNTNRDVDLLLDAEEITITKAGQSINLTYEEFAELVSAVISRG